MDSCDVGFCKIMMFNETISKNTETKVMFAELGPKYYFKVWLERNTRKISYNLRETSGKTA